MPQKRVPPRWVVRLAWSVHRAIYRLTPGRFGLWRPRNNRWGTLRLTTRGRRSGRPRSVILAYIEDGPRLVTLAMNGWSDGEPAWWLNLQADPDARVELADCSRRLRAREAVGAERDRIWKRWSGMNPDLDEFAALRSTPTAVVILQ